MAVKKKPLKKTVTKKKAKKKKTDKKRTSAKKPKTKPRKGQKYTKAEKLTRIAEAIKELGWANLDKTALMKDLGVGRTVFYEHVAEVWQNIQTDDLKYEQLNVKCVFDKNEEVLNDLLRSALKSAKDKERVDAGAIVSILAEIRKTQESKGKVFEQFGLKDKIADELNLNLSGDSDYWAKIYEAVHGKKPN